MNRINRKLLLISLGILALVGLGLFAVNRYQVSRYGDFYFARAREARDVGNLASAIAQYRQAIRLGKREFDSYSELAQLLVKVNDPKAAQIAALRAEQLKSGDQANQRLLAEVSLMLGQSSDVFFWTDKLLSATPTDPEMRVLRGRANIQSKDFTAAALEYERAIENPAAPIDAYVELATLHSDLMKSLKDGCEVMERLREKGDRRIESLVKHGSWHLNQYVRRSISSSISDLDSIATLLKVSQQDAESALAEFPSEPSAHSLAMRVANVQGRYEDTLRMAEHAINQFPAEREIYVLATSAATESKQSESAQKYVQLGLRQFPMDAGLLWELANLQLEQKDIEGGRTTLKKLQATSTPEQQTRYLNGRFLAAEGKYLDAIKEFESVRAELVNSPEFQKIVDIELAYCLEGIGDRPGQIQVLRRATAQNSGWLAAREQLAFALLAAGRIDEATEEYASIASGKSAPVGAALNLARLMVIQNVTRNDERKNWNQVEAILEKIEQATGAQDELAIVRAESLLAQDRVDEARQVLAILSPSSANFAARILLEVDQLAWSEADALIAETVQQGFDSVELRRARAIRAVLGEVTTMKETLRELAVVPDAWAPEQKLELQKELLPIAASAGFEEMVQELGDAILEKDPNNLTSRFEILELQRRRKDREGMQETLSKIEEVSGQNAIWNYGQAIALVVDPAKATPPDYERSQQYLNQASMLRPDWADVPALSGVLFDKSGELFDKRENAEAAIQKYEQAIKLGWKRLETAQRLLKLLIDRGRFTEADDMIRRLSQSSPALSSRMSRAASEISWKLDNLTRAVEKAEEAAQLSQSPDDFLWLSQIRRISKDREGAEAALKTALQLAPTNSNVLVTWIDFLRESARVDEARTAALRLESQIDPSDSLQLLTLAEIFGKLEMTGESGRMSERIDPSKFQTVTDHDRYYRLKSALSPELRQEYLEDVVVSAGQDEDPSVLMWARRQLAILALNQTTGPDYLAAKELLERNMETPVQATNEDPKRIEDRRLLALLAAYKDGNQDPATSLQKFEELLRDGWTPNSDDLFLVGRLHIANEDWTRGSRYFIQLLNRTEGRNPSHIKFYVIELLKRNDPREAELWLDVLRREGVQDTKTAELLAEIRYRRGQVKELLRDLVGEETNYPETEWFQATVPLRRRFELLNEYLTKLQENGNESVVQQFAEASEKLGAALESSSDFPGAFYATQLLARGEVAKSITALERVVESISTLELASFVDSMLIAEGVATDQLDRLDQVISKLDRPSHASVLGIISARLKETRGEYSIAERIYRGILDSDPENAAALNNISNLLALKGQNLGEALDLVERAIKLETANDPKKAIPMLLDTRGVCHIKRKEYDLALKDLGQAVSQSPHPLLRFHLAWALAEARQSAAAKLELQKALESGLEKSMTHVLERGEYDRLIRDLKIETGPNQ